MLVTTTPSDDLANNYKQKYYVTFFRFANLLKIIIDPKRNPTWKKDKDKRIERHILAR